MGTAKTRVIVAMSGGVDSSVAAAWLVDRGHEVVGVTLHLWDYPDDGSTRGRCCAPEDQHDARRVADALGIAHYAFDRRELFAREVVAPFVEAYVAGATPSPCVACNRAVKMRELFALADRLGATHVATGHYARIADEPGGKVLLRGRDRAKDQSYFLHALGPRELERLVFPLGDSTKAEVRADALRRELPGADKGESQELCFVPTGRYDAFVAERADGRARPGKIVDRDGREVGRHEGLHAFTIGQRRGLGVALGRPVFVVGLDAATATVRLGDEGDLAHRGARLEGATFREGLALPARGLVQVRSRHDAVPAVISHAADGSHVVLFDEPVRAVSAGQAAVLYDGERVQGGGTIAEVLA